MRGSFAVDGKLTAPYEPRLEGRLSVPGVMQGGVSLELLRKDGWTLEGQNDLQLDLGGIRRLIPRIPVQGIDSLALAGTAEVSNELHVRLQASAPMVDALIRSDLRAEGVSAEVRTASGSEVQGEGSVSLDGALQILTELKGRFEAALPLEVQASATSTVKADGFSAAAQIERGGPDDAFRVSAKGEGLEMEISDEIEFSWGGRWNAESVAELRCTAESFSAAFGQDREVNVKEFSARMQADADFPNLDELSAGGRLQVGNLNVRDDRFGSLDVPVELDLSLSGTDLLSPKKSKLLIDTVHVKVSEAATLQAGGRVSGLGRKPSKFHAEFNVSVAEALRLTEGLSPEVRDMVGGLSADGSLECRVEVAGALSAEREELPEVALKGSAALVALSYEREEMAVGAEALHAVLDARCKLGPGLRPEEMAGSLKVVGEGLGAGELLSLNKVQFETEASGLRTGEGDANISFSVEGLRLALPGAGAEAGTTIGPFDLRGEGEVEANLTSGDFVLERLQVAVPDVLRLSVPSLLISGFGAEALRGEVNITVSDLAACVGLAPEQFTSGLPELAGTIVVDAAFDGRLPLAGTVLEAVRQGGPLPEMKLFPLDRFFRENVPMQLELRAVGEGISAAHEVPGGRRLAVSGLSTDASMEFDDGVLSAGFSAALPSVSIGGASVEVGPFEFSGALQVEAFETFRIEDVEFSGPEGLFRLSAGAEGSGLSRVMSAPSLRSVLEELDVSLKAGLGLDAGQVARLAGIEGEGSAGVDFSLRLDGGTSAAVAAMARLDNLSVSREGLFRVVGLSGTLPLVKSWRLVPAGGPLRQTEPLSERVLSGEGEHELRSSPGTGPALGPAAERLLGASGAVSLGSLEVLGRELMRGLSADVELRGGDFSVPRLSLEVLGGSLTARFYLTGEAGELTASCEQELTGVDLRLLLPRGYRRFSGDATVDGNMRVSLALAEEGDSRGASPLKGLSAELNVTHIGSEALRSLMLAADPQEQNPNIVRIRSKLRLASPRLVTVELKRGFVAADVELRGLASPLVSRYSIPRFSIAGLLGSERLSSLFSRANLARRALRVLSARQIELDEVGRPVTGIAAAR